MVAKLPREQLLVSKSAGSESGVADVESQVRSSLLGAKGLIAV